MDNHKVRELATVCLPWQHWTKALVWFDEVDISECHSCVVVVDLRQSLSEWHLLLSACVLVCRRENVGARIKLVKLGKNGNEIREMLVQVYRGYAMKKTAVYKRVKPFF
jgi:hypothetical protein